MGADPCTLCGRYLDSPTAETADSWLHLVRTNVEKGRKRPYTGWRRDSA